MTTNPLQDALKGLLADARAIDTALGQDEDRHDLEDDSAAIARLNVAARRIRQSYGIA